MKIKLLFFALMVVLSASAQVAFKVNSPAGVFGSKSFVLAGKADSTLNICWGNGDLTKKKVTADVVYISTDGCDASKVNEDVSGKIAFVKRGACTFLQKIEGLANKGASAVVIVNNITAIEQFSRDTNVLFTSVRQYANTQYPFTQQEIDDRMAVINMKNGYQDMSQITSQADCDRAKKIKIPAIMISKLAGEQISAALMNGNVNATIEKGLVDYDLAIDPNIAMPMYRSRPESMVKSRMLHDTLGFIMINKGALAMKNVVADLKISMIDQNYQPIKLILKDSIYFDSIDGSGGKDKRDTLSTRFVFKSKEDLKVGKYEIYWKLRTVNNKTAYTDTVLDMVLTNNYTKGYFQITDSILSVNDLRSVYYDTMKVLGILDSIKYTNIPSFGGFLNVGTKLNDDFKVCQVYESDYAKGLAISSVTFTAMRKLKDSLRGSKVNAYAYLWQPAVKNITDANFNIQGNDLSLLDSVSYTFNDFKGKVQNRRFGAAEIKFKNGGVIMQDNARYLVCVATKDSAVMFGVSKSYINKWRTEYFNNRILSPIYTNGVGQNSSSASWFNFGWGDYIINSLAVNVGTAKSAECDLKTFAFVSPAVTGIISGKNVNVTVPKGTDLTKLKATFTSSDKSKVYINGVEQVSGISVNNFKNNVEYVVVAEDGTKSSYYVNVCQPTESLVQKSTCTELYWNGNTYTQSGTYQYKTTNAKGCDSIVTLNLIVNKSTSSKTIFESCGSYTWNGKTYNQSGNYEFVTKNSKGCDSIATLILTINNGSTSSESKVACGSYEWNGKVYTQSGKYDFRTKTVKGCDSTATLYLTVNNPYNSSTTIKECGSYTWNGKTYTQSGKYDLSYKAKNGCDSIITLNLTILSPTNSTTTKITTGSYLWNGVNYNQSGIYTYKTMNVNGCDSIATLLLTINKSGTSTTIMSACEKYEWNGSIYTQTGTYTYTTKNAKGLDSIATLLLTINNSVKTTITQEACGSYTWNGKTYTQSGKYDFISKTSKGCDSVASLFLTINTPKTTIINQTSCGSYAWNGKTYTQSGKYEVVLKSANGCDSIITLNLIIASPTTSTSLYTTTGNYVWNGVNYTKSGIYTYTTKNKTGCDSIATLLLTINAPGTSTTIINACDSYKWNGNTYNQSGTYIFNTKNSKGLDSIANLLLTVNKSTFSIINEVSCGNFTWNGKTYTQSGKYDFVTKNSKGCDSIVTLNLSINPMPTIGVENINSTLVSSQSNASYQWFNCDSLKTILPNSTNQKFLPIHKGNYAVKINLNGCIDTSACVKFENQSTTSISDVVQLSFNIYPNPNNGIFNVSGLNTGTYKIYDVLGTVVSSFKVQNNEQIQLDLTHLAKGVYHFANEAEQRLNTKVVITD